MKKILICYFSGVGATKKVASLMYTPLLQECAVDMSSIENHAAININKYDALIIGTPVYHADPSRLITDYFAGINPLIKPTPAFIYNTRALWSCNTNRILAKQLLKKNIVTVMDREYQSPASDGSLLVPFIQIFFEFERNIQEKITLDCAEFMKLLQKDNLQGYVPRFRLSGILNAPNKLSGRLVTFKIHLHRERCVKCGKCISGCPHKAVQKNNSGYPVFEKTDCENCYRCIHHCPQMALSLSKRKKVSKVLKYD